MNWYKKAQVDPSTINIGDIVRYSLLEGPLKNQYAAEATVKEIGQDSSGQMFFKVIDPSLRWLDVYPQSIIEVK
jgi:hypothetical protein|tara:strand:- start:1759 stop:1980 length:222 start_codon:yes stop_codon:yes gene_type:complete